MTNKATSEPLFGSATKKQIAAIEKHMHEFTERVVKNKQSAKKLLKEIGAIEDPSNAEDCDTKD